MFQIVGLGVAALLLSYFGVAGIRRWVARHEILDLPNERSSHSHPTPRGGGLAIVFVALLGFVFAWLQSPVWPVSSFLAYFVGAMLVAATGWLDDVRSLSSVLRFAIHSFAAVLAIWGLGYWRSINMPFLGQLYLGWLGFPFTFLWIVGLTNAYNFMDGIDGIAGGQAVVAGLGWAILGWLSGQSLSGMLGLLIAATSLGFLGHNWLPARVFMGDVGSTFLGYSLAILSVVAAQNATGLALAGVLLVWPFVFDTTLTFLRRLFSGENVFVAHRSHLYQRLVITGYRHNFVATLYIALAVIGLSLAVVWCHVSHTSPLIMAVSMPTLCGTLWAFVRYRERKVLAGKIHESERDHD